MRAALRRWRGFGFVQERGSSGFRFLMGLGIVLRFMSLALSLRLRMGGTGSSVIGDGSLCHVC